MQAARRLLDGQNALVTGASSGIGRAIAIALTDEGAEVVVNYVSGDDAARAVVDEIAARGGGARAHRADVSHEDEVRAMFAASIAALGTIDNLVSNAGLQRDAPLTEMTLEQWNTVIGVNLTGQFLCAREAVRELRRRGVVESVSRAAGKIICISSRRDVAMFPCLPIGGPRCVHAIAFAREGAVQRIPVTRRTCGRSARHRSQAAVIAVAVIDAWTSPRGAQRRPGTSRTEISGWNRSQLHKSQVRGLNTISGRYAGGNGQKHGEPSSSCQPGNSAPLEYGSTFQVCAKGARSSP